MFWSWISMSEIYIENKIEWKIRNGKILACVIVKIKVQAYLSSVFLPRSSKYLVNIVGYVWKVFRHVDTYNKKIYNSLLAQVNFRTIWRTQKKWHQSIVWIFLSTWINSNQFELIYLNKNIKTMGPLPDYNILL